MPGYWRDETSGVLRPAVEAYLLEEGPMSPIHIGAMRAYLRQWMDSPHWRNVDDLRARLDKITDRQSLDAWLNDAVDAGIDPL